MRTWMSTLIVLLVAASAYAQDPGLDDLAGPQFGLYAIGNEYEVGGGVLVETDEFTSLGIDGRWLDGVDGDGWSVSGVVMWTVVPDVQIPVGGLLPQFQLPLPQAIACNLNIGGRLGYQEAPDADDGDALCGLLAELEFNAATNATVSLRYEYQFDADMWGSLPDDPQQHQAFLVLKYAF